MKSTILCMMVFLLFPALLLFAQPQWKRSEPAKQVDLELFHATMTGNFPTTETINKGDFQFEISHRFLPPINEGYDALWGLDGPVNIRLGLGYGITNRFMATLSRSNVMGNVDLQLRYKLLQFRNNVLPGVVALQGGAAWNTNVPDNLERESADPKNFQYYAQLIYNVMFLNKKLGVGLVPSYLYNSDIFSEDYEYTFTLGNYYQYYFNMKYSVWVEYNPIITGYQGPIEYGKAEKLHNSLALGFDVETGGHFFHLFITNNSYLNPSQFLVGADRSVSDGDWRIAFAITRHL